MRTAAVFQRYTSIDDQAEQLTGFDQSYQQLDRGSYRGAFLACDDDEVGFFVVPRSVVHALMLEVLTAPSAAEGSSHGSIQLYRAARDVMAGTLTHSLTMPEIASRVGTSRRTLEQAFDTCVSVSPARFHKLLRLNNARRLLESGRHSVSRAATSSGLHHLGRFSSDYQELFGEFPSETALRAKVLIAGPAPAGT